MEWIEKRIEALVLRPQADRGAEVAMLKWIIGGVVVLGMAVAGYLATQINSVEDALRTEIQWAEDALRTEIKLVDDTLSAEIELVEDTLSAEIKLVEDELRTEIQSVEDVLRKEIAANRAAIGNLEQGLERIEAILEERLPRAE